MCGFIESYNISTMTFFDFGAVSVNAAIYDQCSTWTVWFFFFFFLSNLCFVAVFYNEQKCFFNLLLLLLCKQNLRSHSHLKPPASSLRTLHALKLYSGSTRRESWLVNSHTPLYSNNGIWLVKTVVHLSAVLQPYWSTEEGWGGGSLQFLYITSVAEVKNTKCNIKYDRTLWRQIAILNCSLSDIW